MSVNSDEFEIVGRRHPWRWFLSLLIAIVSCLIIWQVARNDVFNFATVPAFMFDPRILEGVVVTLYVTCGSMLVGLVLGIVLAIMRVSDNPVMQVIAGSIIWFFRGTPVLVQLIFWFNIGIIFPNISLSIPNGPVLFDISTNALMTAPVAAILGLGLNEGAYMSEIVRAGFLSISRGQREAAKALGLPPGKVMARIELPQALRVIIPPTGNQFISLLKTSSLISVIAAGDLLTQSTRIYNENFRILELLVVASLWYLFLTTIFSVIQHYIERIYSRGFTDAHEPSLLRIVNECIATIFRRYRAKGGNQI